MRLENTNRKILTGQLAETNRKEENMKHPVKKIISHLLMFALVLCVAIAPSLAESKPDCLQTISGENGTTYSNLFDVILSGDYGSDLAALQQYMKGAYAYWLAAGIDANADAETIDNVIALFCTENLSAEE